MLKAHKTRLTLGRIVALFLALVLIFPPQLAVNAAEVTEPSDSNSSITASIAKTVRKDNSEDNEANQQYLRVKNGNASNGEYVRDAYLVFPLEGLTQREFVNTTVKLKLYVTSVESNFGSSSGVKVYTGTPLEGAAINYNNAETKLCNSGTHVYETASLSVDSWFEVDITDRVKKAVESNQEAIAVVIQHPEGVDSNNGIQFASLKHTDSTKHPYLSVETAAIQKIYSLTKIVGQKGKPVALPETVTAQYDGHNVHDVPVTWSDGEKTVTEVTFSEEGTYMVTGTVTGWSGSLELTVEIIDGLADKVEIINDNYVQGGDDAAKFPYEYGVGDDSNKDQRLLRVKTAVGHPNSTYTRRIYLSADISNLHTGENRIIELVMKVMDKGRSWDYTTVNVHRLTGLAESVFNYSTISWNHQPAHDSEVYASFTKANIKADTDGGELLHLDVTDAVKSAKDAGENVIGFMFEVPADSANDGNSNEYGIDFHSSRAENEADRPYLLSVPSVAGHSAVLDEQVGLKFHMNSDATPMFKLGDKVLEATKDTNENVYTVNLAAKQMTDQIDCYIGEELVDSYSVAEYANAILNAENVEGDNDLASTKALLKAMLNYGAKAQIQFGYNTDSLANVGVDAPALPEAYNDLLTAAAVNKATWTGTEVAYYGSSLFLNSQVSIRHYFTATDEAAAGTLGLVKDSSSDLYYTDLPALKATELRGVQTYSKEGYGSISYGAYAYAAAVNAAHNNNTAYATLKELTDALVIYGEAAKGYVDAHRTSAE